MAAQCNPTPDKLACSDIKRVRLRLVVYNIRYATGTGPAFHLPVPGAGYLRSSRRVLAGLTEFLRKQDADIIGLIEVDTGSVRSGHGQPGRAHRRQPRALLDLRVQVRRGVGEPLPAHRAQAGQCLPGRAARAWRAVPLLRFRASSG